MLKIHNSLAGEKQVFIPIKPGKVRMYVCGMTVYDYCHLGHARVLVVFDTMVRYLRDSGYEVTYVRNITDIDDKIIQRANENKETVQELTERFIKAMHEDCKALGVRPPDHEPRAMQSMDAIIAMVQTLIDNGSAYQADNGDVYYGVNGFKNYGLLSGKRLDDLRAGARVEVDAAKRDPMDFVLWKSTKAGEPSWDAPWGPGRPGWHIECSAMSTQCLGNHFDIHGGGMDLKFPHHENEIAQSEAATGEKFVNYWIHNGFVEVDQEKMSKSVGNFFTVREVLNRYRAEEIRYFILASHYRSPLHYSHENLDQAKAALTRLYTALRGLPAAKTREAPIEKFLLQFRTAMDDDFNTSEALVVLFELAREINKVRERDLQKALQLGGTLRALGAVLGLLESEPEVYLKGSGSVGLTDTEIESMIHQRLEARGCKDWGEADRIRDELAEQGIVLEDGAGGTTWRRA